MAASPTAGSKHFAAVERDRSLLSPSFMGLLLTQLLGASNDNILRWLIIGVGKQHVEQSGVGMILAAGTVAFVLPYLLLAAPAGYLADRFSKRQVIVACKLAEMVIMALAVGAILVGEVWLLLAVLGLMGAQSALFGPSKLGSIPEMLDDSRISAANGLIGLTTVIATAVGSVVGSVLADVTGPFGQEGWWLSALVLLGVAGAGWGTSLLIKPLPVAAPDRRFPWDAWQQTFRDLKTLAKTPGMLRVAIGIAFFWSLGGLANLNIDQFAVEGGSSRQSQMAGLLVALVVGVGAGSVLAGVWSKGRVELGMLPLGAGGLAFCGLMLFTVEGELFAPSGSWTLSYVAASVLLFLLGFSGGLFDVPLASYMQRYSPSNERGSILAASNFITFSGILLASLAFMTFRLPTRDAALENVTQQYESQSVEHEKATLIWEEMLQVKQSNLPLDKSTFMERYPAHPGVVDKVYDEVNGHPFMSARQIFLLCGVLTIPVFAYIVVSIPQATIRFLAWLITHTFYRIKLKQVENLPEEGAALLAPNHVSWLDGLLLVAISQRPVRMIVAGSMLGSWWSDGIARIMQAIPIKRSPKAARSAIATARDALNNGELVCMFPEGAITRSGQLQPFRPGMLEILKGTNASVLPVYLDELWGSIFTFRGGRFFWKWPTKLLPRRVSIWFGEQIESPKNIYQVRDAVQQLSATAATARKQHTMILPRAMIRKCRKSMFRWKIADSSGVSLTGGQILLKTFILRRLLQRDVFTAEEKYVGILIPPSTGAVVVNNAVTLCGKVACNLNYTVSAEIMNRCIAKAGIKHVLTTQKVLDKLDMKIDAEIVLLEDFKEKVTLADKLAGVTMAYATPAALLDQILGLNRLTGDDELTVIFTSGSTGDPKGVVLTFHNVGSNVDAIDHVIHLTKNDTVLGVVPFFHSLGFTVTLWTIMGLDVRAAYHFSPLEAKQIGKLAKKWDASVMLATPTFLRNYLRRCDPADFEKLEIAVGGAEKLPVALCEAFEKKFGVRPVEGYGTTELSPLVSVNVPPSRSHHEQIDLKEGTVGRPVPGVAAKIVDPDSFEDLPIDTAGMLMVKGPNVMKGYLNQPEKTAEVMRDGWYTTGDLAKIDKHGFIEITGRLSRFSKIGGEMVPHLKIEESIAEFVADGNEDEVLVVVSSVPDERKGERLIVLHKKLNYTPEQIIEHLRSLGLPNIYIPGKDSFLEVEEIPLLGTGKLDLKGISDLAWENFGDK
ncbi:MFS transporter [Adhaeretor mobilis]|uniref:Bifunctional protein Aas n=1 Tax=Adhaeretor mobilis TaxID=1930276 RepID=A0A517MV40_9BACT|nr:MFS transporter [Adhaeretor mobilis]QDS98750.1 Bifunctional protein Aas [Adhaeretor mobilis]